MTVSSDEFMTANCGRPSGLRTLAMGGLVAVACLSAAVAFAQNAQQPNGNGAVPIAPAQVADPTQPVAAAAGTAPAPQSPAVFPAQPAPAQGTAGFVYTFGQWWDSTRGKFDDLTKGPNDAAKGATTVGQDAVQDAVQATKGATAATQGALKDAAQATQAAATALFRLPATRMIEVHQRCAIAPNGAPDCRMAAAAACRGKGFHDGNPVDVQSSENCPPAVWISGRNPAPGECPEETVILMVACR